MDEQELENILASSPLDRPSTKAMRRALYKMGRSRSWVHRYAMNMEEASRVIDSAMSEMEFLKFKERNSTAVAAEKGEL